MKCSVFIEATDKGAHTRFDLSYDSLYMRALIVQIELAKNHLLSMIDKKGKCVELSKNG